MAVTADIPTFMALINLNIRSLFLSRELLKTQITLVQLAILLTSMTNSKLLGSSTSICCSSGSIDITPADILTLFLMLNAFRVQDMLQQFHCQFFIIREQHGILRSDC
jgi:hypothetical protein